MFLQSRGRTRLTRITVWAAVLGLLLGVLSSLALAADADAHAQLASVSPADGARLSQAPTKVVLTFDEPVAQTFAVVTVTSATGTSVSEGRAVVNGAVVTQRLAVGLTSGTYTVAFRVVSDDGHPVSDLTTFTLALPAGDAAAPTVTPLGAAGGPGQAIHPGAASATNSEGSNSTLMRAGLAVGVGALALAAGTALIAASRRGRAS